MVMHFKRVMISGEAIVVSFDMCSSTDMFEDLVLRGNTSHYRDLVAKDLKHHLAAAQSSVLFDPYKFTGDGWILLFPSDTSGAALLEFLKGLCQFYRQIFKTRLRPHLGSLPKLVGLTFGLEKGRIEKMTIFQQHEYVGRGITVACRLQSAVKSTTKNPVDKALVSGSLFEDYFRSIGVRAGSKTVPLRNIRDGRAFRSKLINLAVK